jgi:hypothetical protein
MPDAAGVDVEDIIDERADVREHFALMDVILVGPGA